MSNARMENQLHQEGGVKMEEILIPDMRFRLTPADMVDGKLVSLLRSLPLPVSQLHGAQLLRRPC